MSKVNYPNTPTPPKTKPYIHKRPKNSKHPKGITNSRVKLPKFQTSSTPTKIGPHPKSKHHQVPVTLNLIYTQATRLGSRKNKNLGKINNTLK